ncbi:MAG: thiol:disulfide interchange protein precursor [Bacteroidetes bacterium ADurb.Bin012]|jgi:thioredoxin-related protein|nr:MAG: thiol:disulfide interchange protein precursor [Bacteroidetes bacterium ADurb.Bin012]
MDSFVKSAKLRLVLFVVLLTTTIAFQPEEKSTVQWQTFESAIAKNEGKIKKKVFIDVYTDWCGWCKKMDATTFSEKAVASYMNEHFYCGKLNAERCDSIRYNGKIYVNTCPSSKKSAHQLAIALLQGRMYYPSYVILDENNQKLTSFEGYLKPEEMMPILVYFAENHYLKMSWENFKKEYDDHKK